MRSSRDWGWQFIDLAELGINTARSYVVTVLSVVFLPIVFLAVTFAAVFGAGRMHWLSGTGERGAVIAAAFASIVVAGAALARRVSRTHRRPWLSLVSPDLAIDWRRLAIGAAVQGGLLLLSFALSRFAAGQPSGADSTMAPITVALLLLVPFQAASEEMLFRGYLTQALGRVLRNRIAIVATVGLLFGAIHFNAYGPLTLPYLFGLSLIYSLASLRDERLELAIGAHTAMNWVGVIIGDAFRSGGGVKLGWPAVVMLVVHGALFYILTRLGVRLFCRPRAAS